MQLYNLSIIDCSWLTQTQVYSTSLGQ